MFSAQIPGHFVAVKGENTGRLKPKANKQRSLFAHEVIKAACITGGIQMLKDADAAVDYIQENLSWKKGSPSSCFAT